MERAIEVMLVEVLTNLFRDNPPNPPTQPPDGSSNGSQNGNSSQGGNSDSSPATPGNGSDLQRDGAELDNEVPGERGCGDGFRSGSFLVGTSSRFSYWQGFREGLF